MQVERAEYADKRRKGPSLRLVKLPGDGGYKTSGDAPETIARRLKLDASEKRARLNGRK